MWLSHLKCWCVLQGKKGKEEIAKKAETESPDKNVEEKTVGPTQEEYDKLQGGV